MEPVNVIGGLVNRFPNTPPAIGLDELINAAAQRIRSARRVVAVTGAGLSVESGIPSFHAGAGGQIGLWERYDPMEYGTAEAFDRDPSHVWVMLREVGMTLRAARPNSGHLALARMESGGCLATIITQNVDGLHQEAGSVQVIELHGSWRTLSCVACAGKVASRSVNLSSLPPRCTCGGVLRPDVTLFGELIPASLMDTACAQARDCDCMLVVGTSSSVYPAAALPVAAAETGAFVIEINPHPALPLGLPNLWLASAAGVILPRLVEALGVGRES